MKKIQSLIGVLCVLTLCICMSGCNQTEKNEDKIGVGNPEEELAVSPYTSGETDEGITNLSDINMSLKKLDKDKKELIILLENTGEKTYRYGKYFEIEKKINGKWYQLVQNDKDSEDHGEVLESKNNIDLNYNIEQYYSSLTVGEYRIIIQLYYMKDEKDWDYKTYNVALEFNI